MNKIGGPSSKIRTIIAVYDPMEKGGGGGGGPAQTSTPAYEWIFESLAHRYRSGALAQDHSHLVGLIVGRPSEPLVKEQIVPNLDYWHHRSADYVDLFCIGFLPRKEFEAGEFNRALASLESNTRWNYRGGRS